VRRRGAARIVVASPVAPASVAEMLHHHAEEVHCVLTPEDFGGVGAWYDDFSQTGDREVRSLLEAANPKGKNIGPGDPEPLVTLSAPGSPGLSRHES